MTDFKETLIAQLISTPSATVGSDTTTTSPPSPVSVPQWSGAERAGQDHHCEAENSHAATSLGNREGNVSFAWPCLPETATVREDQVEPTRLGELLAEAENHLAKVRKLSP